jgi:Chlorophyll A-B binding protein
MTMLSFALIAALVASATAFAPSSKVAKSSSLKAAEIWDPMGLYELGSGEAFDTFPGVFPDKQYLQASEIKQGRMAMLAWTGVWATTKVRCCCCCRPKVV